jgi:hypothetical protein
VLTGVTYWWGFAGGLVAAVFVYAFPSISYAALTGDVLVTRDRALWMAALMLFLSGAAGLVALIPDEVTRGQAISLGLGSQAIVKGLVSGARDAVPPTQPRLPPARED